MTGIAVNDVEKKLYGKGTVDVEQVRPKLEYHGKES